MKILNAKRLLPLIVVAGAVLVMTGTSAIAQDGPISVNIGVGPIFPNGKVADRFDTGYTIPVGITYNINRRIGVQFEYMYGHMGGPSRVLPDATDPNNRIRIDSNHSMNNGTFNFVFKMPTSGSVGTYVLGGPGFYHRTVELTTPDIGYAVVCDPYWYYCFPGFVPVEVQRIIGSRSTTDFGLNVGGGVTFGNFYAEVRYHYARGPEIGGPQFAGGLAQPVRASGHYVPINFGIRF